MWHKFDPPPKKNKSIRYPPHNTFFTNIHLPQSITNPKLAISDELPTPLSIRPPQQLERGEWVGFYKVRTTCNFQLSQIWLVKVQSSYKNSKHKISQCASHMLCKHSKTRILQDSRQMQYKEADKRFSKVWATCNLKTAKNRIQQLESKDAKH